ncbi:MAG: MurR/RpiR family transcriptional regulator [Acutalibacteraceae bacterium]|nr:MurR/RpiR family transcriptional regulator [Clostridiales bacterium]
MSSKLLSRIENLYPTLSKSHKKVAKYILENYDKAAFMTAATLGKTVDISESTVVRFATHLGYDGYPELQKTLQEMIKSKLTAVQRMEVTSVRMSSDDVLDKVLSSDVDMIKTTLENISKEDFKLAVEAINKAKKIYILGVRSSASLASFIAFYFNLMYDQIELVDSASPSGIFEQIFKITSDDVCIAISFPRYSKQTINALQFIQNKGAKVVAITDSNSSPIAKFSNYVLVAKSDMASFVDSLVAPLSVINALIVAVTLENKDNLINNFSELENVWEKYEVYEKMEETLEDV